MYLTREVVLLSVCSILNLDIMNFIFLLRLSWKSARRNNTFGNDILDFLFKYIYLISILFVLYITGSLLTEYGYEFLSNKANPLEFIYFYSSIAILIDLILKIIFKRTSFRFAFIQQLPNTKRSIKAYWILNELFSAWNIYLIIFFFSFITNHIYPKEGIIKTMFLILNLFILQLLAGQLASIIQYRRKVRVCILAIIATCLLLLVIHFYTDWEIKMNVINQIALVISSFSVVVLSLNVSYNYIKYCAENAYSTNTRFNTLMGVSLKGNLFKYNILFLRMLFRSPRMRQELIIAVLLSVLYFFVYTKFEDRTMLSVFSMNVIFSSIIFIILSLLLNQYIFSAEASFFDKLSLLPDMRKLLLSRYLIFVISSVFVYLIWFLIYSDTKSIFQTTAIYVYSLGPILVSSFGSILFANHKIDLFVSNMKLAANSATSQSLFIILTYSFWIGIINILNIYYPVITYKFMFITGCLFIILSPYILNYIYFLFNKNRYSKLSKYRKK